MREERNRPSFFPIIFNKKFSLFPSMRWLTNDDSYFQLNPRWKPEAPHYLFINFFFSISFCDLNFALQGFKRGTVWLNVKNEDWGRHWHWETKTRGANGIRYPGNSSRRRWILDAVRIDPCSAAANALSIPPREYVHKNKIQRNWQGLFPRRS